MDYISKAEAVLPKGWDVYTSGGGCYHASKTIEGVAVEIGDEGFANIYKRDDDKTYAETVEEVYANNYDPNYVNICYVSETGIFNWHEGYERFSYEALCEIKTAVVLFDRVFTTYENEGENKVGMNKVRFYLDGFEGTFEGYTFGQRWNGWQVPYFTKEVGQAIMDEMNNDEGNTAVYDEERDMFVVSNTYDDGTEEFPGMDIAGDGEILHLYPIGSGSWVWDIAKEEEPEPESVRELREFRKQMKETLFQLWDELDAGDYNHKFDLKIEWNGKKIDLPMHADLYSRFERFIDESIEEELE
jgi:hypothetical protein